ncbi:MAG: chromosome partitioning protein [Actinobacteria bacterium]|uniref:Unannotated protein n=1 Tax=freshwater metagenome TaxID=449393 RepID=A0A6J7S8U0_9ZZZZ|nr:chromosome partitioning protein [Actinomycetota bacterium]
MAMSDPVLVLLGPTPWEGSLIAGLAHPSSRVTIARRCLDTADLLAATSAGLGRVVIVGADAARLDADVLQRIRILGVGVVAVVTAGDHDSARRMERWGVDSVVHVEPSDLGIAVRAIALAVDRAVRPEADLEIDDSSPEERGRLVAVWGPAGAPGRTSVALAIADEASRAGVSTLLIDADTWAASVGIVLGLVDDGAGIASACRRALGGALDPAALGELTRQVRHGFLVLPGLPRAGRWTEVRAAAMVELLDVARQIVDLVVVDCGFSLESDEELVFDTEAPRRNAATFASLEAADVVFAVGAGDPVGLVRLVSGLSELADVVPGCDRRLVVTRVREAMLGKRAEAAIADSLLRHAGVDAVCCVPDDRGAYDAALRQGATLAEIAPSSRARQALRSVAHELIRDLGLSPARPARAAKVG